MFMLFLISNHKSYLIISGKAFYIIYCTDSKRILNLFDNVKREFIQEKGLSNGDTTKCSDIFKDYQLSVSKDKPFKWYMVSRSFFADSSYMLSFSVLCSCVCSRLISPSVSSWHKQDNTLMHQSPGHIQRRTPYNF